MGLNFFGSLFRAKPSIFILINQPLNQILSLITDMIRYENLLIFNIKEDLVSILRVTVGDSNKHFKKEYPKLVPIDCLTIRFILNQLWPEIIKTPTKTFSPFSAGADSLLRQAKVDDLNMPPRVEDYIFRL